MRETPRRIFGAKRFGRTRRRMTAGVLLAAAATWAGLHFHSAPTIPACDSTPVKREVTQSLARMLSAAPREVTPSGLRSEGRSEAGPATSRVRHCAAEVALGGQDRQIVRFNVVPSKDAKKGYRVQVAAIASEIQRP